MRAIGFLLGAVLVTSCATTPPTQRRAGVLDYLYPVGQEASPPRDVNLVAPVRVGIAFAPETQHAAHRYAPAFTAAYGDLDTSPFALNESDKHLLLERVAAAFRDVAEVERIEIIPGSYLKAGGGFENVDQIRGLLGIDLIAVLSYEQTQFGDYDEASLLYWTIVGSYFVEGNKNETHTFVDTSVFDIPSRALLFNAGGRSRVQDRSTAIELYEAQRADSKRGFEEAVDAMIVELKTSVARFREEARDGTVRGAGTPAISFDRTAMPEDQRTGAGAVGAIELVALAIAGSIALRRRRAA